MSKIDLTDEALCAAVVEMENGLVDAKLGGGVVKKRVALPGRGKSGSVRTLVATNRSRWFFIFGFEKNDRANISAKELEGLKAISADLLQLTRSELDSLVASETLKEICRDRQEKIH